MMKLGTETGSLVNHLYSRSDFDPMTINVGDGATVLSWSDRTAYTVISVTTKEIRIQRDKAKRIDQNGMSDSQEYSYTANPDGSIEIVKPVTRGNKKGQWRIGGKTNGNAVVFGVRDQHYDYSF
jgi:hypothetical protein